jgi:DNA-binding IclR family transcriptional regulator
MNAGPKNGIRSVDKAMDIIEVLAAEPRGLPLTEIARKAGFRESTTHHLLATLKARGVAEQDKQSRAYRLGHRLVALVNQFMADRDLRSAGIGPIRELRDRSGETSYLTELQGQETVILIELIGHRSLQARRSKLSGESDLHATASGKALMAHADQESFESFLSLPLTKFTLNTITDPEALRTEMETIRRQGYALDGEEHVVGVQCVAAPVFTGQGECVAVASVAYPTAAADRTEELVRLVTTAAGKISANLGYAQDPFEKDREHASGAAKAARKGGKRGS